MGQEPMSWRTHRETCEALAELFRERAITEDEYRRRLHGLGFNAVEIQSEIDANSKVETGE